MSIAETIDKAKVKLLLAHPFFATILLKRPLQETDNVATACTDGEHIWYNGQFIAGLLIDEVCAVLAHEVLHIVFGHFIRQGGRTDKRWNYACDYAINLVLKDNLFKLPKGALLNEKYRGLSAEQIYNVLPEERLLPDGVLIGNVMPPNVSKTEKEKIITRIAKDVFEAAQVAKMRGTVPIGLDRIIGTLAASMMDWHEKLSAYLSERLASDYTFRRPNLHYLHTGFYIPTLGSVELGSFLLAVDTSGSQNNIQLQLIGNEILAILRLAAEPLTVLYCDAAIAGIEVIDPENPPEKLGFKGNGGTDFKPVARWIEEQEIVPEVLIYFTDGQCNSFPDNPSYPVLWVTDNPEMKAPYGEIIVILPS